MIRLCCALLLGLLTTAVVAEVPVYTVKVLEQRPFERRNFVQGLEIHEKQLLVSSGLYGESAIRIYDWPSMSLTREQALPRQFFGEGLTRVNDKIYVLTWRARRLLLLDAETLALEGQATIPGEGWGITHHESRIWFSDGSHRLFSVDLSTGGALEVVDVTLNGQPVHRLNELEWIDGEIWANVWQSDRIVRINPTSGEVTGVIELAGLLATEDRLRDTDVLNGIARDPANGDIWVTGKRWPWLFRIALELTPP